MAGPHPKPVSERFWAKVSKGPGCWEWTGALRGEGGYGVLGCVHGRRGEYAHRVSFELHNGPVPAGLSVLHHCDNKKCVRPEHLFLGTQLDNMHDMMAKGRQRRYDRHGERNPRAILDPEKAQRLREMRRAGSPWPEIMRHFGIGKNTARRAFTGETWGPV